VVSRESSIKKYKYIYSANSLHQALELIIRKLQQQTFEYMMRFFPEDFHMYERATELNMLARTPYLKEAQGNSAALARIQFGEVPVEEEALLISSVMMSLPSNSLEEFVNNPFFVHKFGREKARKLMHEIVQHRERRRKHVLNSQEKIARHSTSPLQMEELRWEEAVDERRDTPTGYFLRRIMAYTQ